MKKIGLLLASFGAAAALIGGTFAVTYLVTDKADPFGVKVSPGEISTDEKTAVTLDWDTQKIYRDGETPTAVTAIDNISNGEVAGPYFVKVRSSIDYTGSLSFSVTDNSGKTSSEVRMIDHVKIYVTSTLPGAKPTYDSIVSDYVPYTTTVETVTTTHYERSINVTCEAGVSKLVYIYVALDDDVSPAVYEQYRQDQVYLEVNWGAKKGDEVVTTSTIYFNKNNQSDWTGDDVFVYAWYKDEHGKDVVNKSWPGVKITDNTYLLGQEYTNVIFSDEDGNQTVDIDVNHVSLVGEPELYLHDGRVDGKFEAGWGTKSGAPVTEVAYYVVGIINGVENWDDTTHPLSLNKDNTNFVEYLLETPISLTAGDEIKVKSSNGAWYGGEGNVKITETASYYVCIARDKDNPSGEGWINGQLYVGKASV